MTERKFLYMNPNWGWHEESDPTTDTITLAGLTMAGDIAMASNEVTGLPATPTGATAAASKAYVDSLVTGVTWKDPVTVIQAIDDSLGTPPGSPTAGDSYIVGGTPAGDWSALNVGDVVEWDGSAWNVILAGSGGEPIDGIRVTVTTATAAGSFVGEEGNIGTYDATGDSWSFETPADGWAFLVSGDGSYWENTSWVYNTADSTWNQFSGAGQINAGEGLSKDGNILNVNMGDGIANVLDFVTVDLATTNPGLALTGTTPDKKLDVKLVSTGGIETTASGMQVKIDDTPDTLDVDADGLKVVGLPSLYKINGTAVGANVTAAAMDTLTDGSNADTLHTHASASATEAPKVEDTHTESEATTAGDVVCWSSTANEIAVCDNGTDSISRCIGVVRTTNGTTSEVVKHGIAAAVGTFTAGLPYYLGASGALVEFSSVPKPGRIIRVGFAVNATDLDVQIMDFGKAR